MGTRVFAKKGNAELIGDERDIMVPKDYYKQVLEWCEQTGVRAINTHTVLAPTLFGVNLWRVKDDRQRMMFMLKWL